jgi:hypothetical protein
VWCLVTIQTIGCAQPLIPASIRPSRTLAHPKRRLRRHTAGRDPQNWPCRRPKREMALICEGGQPCPASLWPPREVPLVLSFRTLSDGLRARLTRRPVGLRFGLRALSPLLQSRRQETREQECCRHHSCAEQKAHFHALHSGSVSYLPKQAVAERDRLKSRKRRSSAAVRQSGPFGHSRRSVRRKRLRRASIAGAISGCSRVPSTVANAASSLALRAFGIEER